MTRPTTILFGALLALASCTSAGPEQAEVAADPTTTSTAAATTTTTSTDPPPTATPSTATPPTTTPPTTALPTTTPVCVRIDDFDEGAELRWTVRNDGVMGGLSVGSVSFADSTMTFAGTINTNGGGFSSVVYDVPSANWMAPSSCSCGPDPTVGATSSWPTTPSRAEIAA